MSDIPDDANAAGDTEVDPEDLYRTEPAGHFKGHLFAGETVRDAGGDAGTTTDHKVVPLCSRRTDNGPFANISPAEIRERAWRDTPEENQTLCGRCLDIAANRLPGLTEPRFDPGEYTVPQLRDELDGLSDAELDAVEAYEREGKARSTALEAIAKQRGGSE